MTRYILIDSNSGYIFGDMYADTPALAAQEIDENLGVNDRTYVEHSRAPHDTRTGYAAYTVPAGFPEITDGQDQNLIDRVDAEGKMVAFVECREAE